MAFRNTHGMRTAPHINVTPLIDVLLVLLIIFMVITPKKPHRYESRIPEKPNETLTDPAVDLRLVVTIPSSGEGYKLNQLEVATSDELGRELLKALDGRPSDQKAIFIKAPRSLGYGKVIHVVDVVKGAGGFPIGLQIEGLEDDSRRS